jgi:hypothetical protein
MATLEGAGISHTRGTISLITIDRSREQEWGTKGVPFVLASL